MRRLLFPALLVLAASVTAFSQPGSLTAVGRPGACPLERTAVTADIVGFAARVRVSQEFRNPFTTPIEAVYTFPLPAGAAVDSMTMRIGKRVIRGRIDGREEAQRVYEQARIDGKAAALLEQQRDNIFTQSVANILPGEKIVVELTYIETLRYERGSYEFVFPMTIGPLYNPDSVADSRKISPAAALDPGHTISIGVNLDSGTPLGKVESATHDIEETRTSESRSSVRLRGDKVIPNRDFVLRYDVAGERIGDAMMTHRSEKGGFFSLILQPPDEPRFEDMTPKELVFVLDSSGSMSGFPIETAKKTIRLSLEGLYPHDTFNLITFAGETSVLFDAPVPATRANLDRAMELLEREGGAGGTEMLTAIRTALAPTDSQEHLRIVCFLTDGMVGNEAEIIEEVRKHPKARVFSLGVGPAPNRSLLDKLASAGGGEADYVIDGNEAEKAASRFYERVRTPMLTDIEIDWNGLPVADVFPRRTVDLYSARPLILTGRFTEAANGAIRLRGRVAGRPYERAIAVGFPESERRNELLGQIWARSRIAELAADNSNESKAETKRLGIEFGLLTPYTSFVAVEEQVRTNGAAAETVEVPVAVPTRREDDTPFRKLEVVSALQRPPQVAFKSVAPKIVAGGVVNGRAVELVKPRYPDAARAVRASGQVAVRVTIDESGRVISAQAVSGHPLLRAAATAAANGSRFSPTLLSGQPVKVSAIVYYNFLSSDSPTVVPGNVIPGNPSTEKPRSPAEKAEDEFRRPRAAVFHHWVYSVFERLRDGRTDPTRYEPFFVADGSAAVELRFAVWDGSGLESLRALGFEVAASNGRGTVTGRIPIGKLEMLTKLDGLKLVLPVTGGAR